MQLLSDVNRGVYSFCLSNPPFPYMVQYMLGHLEKIESSLKVKIAVTYSCLLPDCDGCIMLM